MQTATATNLPNRNCTMLHDVAQRKSGELRKVGELSVRQKLHGAAREMTSLHGTAQPPLQEELLVTDNMLLHVQTERDLLALYVMVYESLNAGSSHRKSFPDFLGVCTRQLDYFLSGKKPMHLAQWVALQKGTRLRMYQRLVNLKCKGLPPNDDRGI